MGRNVVQSFVEVAALQIVKFMSLPYNNPLPVIYSPSLFLSQTILGTFSTAKSLRITMFLLHAVFEYHRHPHVIRGKVPLTFTFNY